MFFGSLTIGRIFQLEEVVLLIHIATLPSGLSISADICAKVGSQPALSTAPRSASMSRASSAHCALMGASASPSSLFANATNDGACHSATRCTLGAERKTRTREPTN